VRGGRGSYSHKREKKSERNRVDKLEEITASSGEFLGRRLTTTLALTRGTCLSVKKRRERVLVWEESRLGHGPFSDPRPK
jgi:hypothetical protein